MHVSDIPKRVELSTKQHDPLAIDEQRLLIPSHLYRSSQLSVRILGFQPFITYIFLQQVPLHGIRMLCEREAIEPVLNSSPSRLNH